MPSRRLLLAAGLAGTTAWLAQPAIRRAMQSIRTSSAPGVSVYELAAGLLMGGHYRDIAQDCADALSGVSAPAILEIGPGPGHLAQRLLDRLPSATWTGLDVDPAMLAAADRRLVRAGTRSRASLIEADVAAIPFGDARFDLVVSSLSAHHWPDPLRGFAEIRRVLRPDGRALVYDLHARVTRFEGEHAGLQAAELVFGTHQRTAHRSVGPFTLVWRADLRP